MAAENINGHHDLDWIELLAKSKATHEAGQKLGRISQKMQDGEWDNNLVTLKEIQNSLGEEKTGRMPLNEIEAMEVPVMKTGWEAYDEHLGGTPVAGLKIVSGAPGSGKTTWALDEAKYFAKTYKNKIVNFYSLEMVDGEIALRAKEVGLKGKYTERININCDPLTVDELFNDAAGTDDLGLIIIDFADILLREDESDASMGKIYTTCFVEGKKLGVPVTLLAQYSYKYQGGIPRPYHIRYTAKAQILGWEVICLWNPHRSFYAEDQKALLNFPLKKDQAAAFIWKFRGGFREHPQDSPGAIIHQFKGRQGWSPFGKWRHVTNY